MGYELKGRMAEVCSCKTFCPCTAGMEPDGGACDFTWGFHFDEGIIAGVDVAGLTMAMVGHLDGAPGVPDTVRLAIYVDDRSTDEQQAALLRAFGGEEGGPLADLAALVGEVAHVERVPMEFDVHEGSGRFSAGNVVKAELEALRGPTGSPTKMTDFALSGVLGATAYAAMPASYHLDAAEHGFSVVPGSATQFEFHHRA